MRQGEDLEYQPIQPSSELRRCSVCGEPVEQLIELRAQDDAGVDRVIRVSRLPCACACERKRLAERTSRTSAEIAARDCADLRRRWRMETDEFKAHAFANFDDVRQPASTHAGFADMVARCRMKSNGFTHPHRQFGCFIQGSVAGTGKSTLVDAMANDISRRMNVQAISIEVGEWLPLLREGAKELSPEEKEQYRYELRTVPWLGLNGVFCDLGTRHLQELHDILEARRNLCTCASSNYALGVMYQSVEERFTRMKILAGACAERIQRLMDVRDFVIPADAVPYSRFLARDRIAGTLGDGKR